MSDLETEVKIYVTNLDELKHHIQNKGGQLVQERVHERNIRYDLDDRSMTRRGIVIRLRHDNSVKLTYKEPGTIERGIVTRQELEVEVSDFDTMEKILNKFGYQDAMLYEKHRTVYACHNTHIMFDELPYGHFIEVEGRSEDIEVVLEELGLHNANRLAASYSKLFDYVKHHLELKFRDLTFENFEDIDVPISAFTAPGSIVIR